jgi:ABC-type glycerol-3-phosphate transport system substrate-binding protein
MKKVLLVLLIAVLAMTSFAGCGVGSDTEGSVSAIQGKETAGVETETETKTSVAWDTSKDDTILVSVINNFYTAGLKKLAEEYMKLHPETKVVIDVVADNESYIAKLATTLSGDRKNAPDIIHGNFMKNAFSADMNYAVEKGYLYNMAEMLDEENPYNGGLVRDAFEETDLSLILNNSGGKYYPYLPFDKLGFALYYNKDILDMRKESHLPQP